MGISYLSREQLSNGLNKQRSDSLDYIILAAGALDVSDLEGIKGSISECVRVLREGGLLFVQGRPDYLPALGVFLDKLLTFKYWIAVESVMHRPTAGLPSVHAGILLFVKGTKRFHVERVRSPHQYCAHCGRTLRDWGGKTHLMHPDGCAISDVWTDLPPADNYCGLSQPVLDRILRMVGPGSGLIAPSEALEREVQHSLSRAAKPEEEPAPQHSLSRAAKPQQEPAPQHSLSRAAKPQRERVWVRAGELPPDMVNVIHCGDAVEVLKQYPDECIDLAFADPPYNLEKSYSSYDDGLADQQYIEWCNSWLAEYVRVLKPTGSLYVLNLPRWSMYHAEFLRIHLHFQNWVVWDALAEPRGKLMPAHYGLLFFTKSASGFAFNAEAVGSIDSRVYCLRASCIRDRKVSGDDAKETLTDIWWDAHRIRHRRDRDYHPCQLPDSLMERIVRLSSNEGDIVLDALSGVGTTAVAAARLGRRYVGIDLDPEYVEITRRKLVEIEAHGEVLRQSTRKRKRAHTKKELQLELRDLASKLGRLPTPEDVERMSAYDVRAFLSLFPTWGKALKAAKLVPEAHSAPEYAVVPRAS